MFGSVRVAVDEVEFVRNLFPGRQNSGQHRSLTGPAGEQARGHSGASALAVDCRRLAARGPCPGACTRAAAPGGMQHRDLARNPERWHLGSDQEFREGCSQNSHVVVCGGLFLGPGLGAFWVPRDVRPG